jgi:hypothetical protein
VWHGQGDEQDENDWGWGKDTEPDSTLEGVGRTD